ncbi:MAG: hypothetical protein ABW168_23695 [Sedimenticola sp.]
MDEADPARLKQAENHVKALGLYFSGNWGEAREAFDKLSRDYPGDPIYPLYLKRTSSGTSQLPDGWDGVYTHTEK